MCKVKAHLYDKHTSWVKSPWNYVNFRLEYPLNSLNLELEKLCEPCNLFLAKVRESQGTWVPKSQGESGNFAKKTALKPWRDVRQFCRMHRGKILFSKSNCQIWKIPGGLFRKAYISSNLYVWSFSGIAHTQQRRHGVSYVSSNRLSR